MEEDIESVQSIGYMIISTQIRSGRVYFLVVNLWQEYFRNGE
ncbi:hypothetical protein THOM_1660 [Trachipleistophora hominis]|uniref:Uncharacterized protein n=1 Tax=Trachipleistophora hominis TaxID=72359 RepID=L7JV55_TRAHO|nr:hypothetical protein THOM_1660 [Trachipleistophora hominis]